MKSSLYLLLISLFLFRVAEARTLHNCPINQAALFPHSTTLAAIDNLNDDYEDNDFAPGLFFFMLFALALVLVLVGVGIALTIIGIALLFGLISFGIISTSVLIGLYKKSFLKGFQTFILLTSITCGILFCGIAFWLLNKIVHWWTFTMAITIGASLGLLAGILFGICSIIVLQKLTLYFKEKLN